MAARMRLPPGIYVDPYELATLQQHNVTKVMAPAPGELAGTQGRTQGDVGSGHWVFCWAKVIYSCKEVPNSLIFLVSPQLSIPWPCAAEILTHRGGARELLLFPQPQLW